LQFSTLVYRGGEENNKQTNKQTTFAVWHSKGQTHNNFAWLSNKATGLGVTRGEAEVLLQQKHQQLLCQILETLLALNALRNTARDRNHSDTTYLHDQPSSSQRMSRNHPALQPTCHLLHKHCDTSLKNKQTPHQNITHTTFPLAKDERTSHM